ncbi:MAG: DUF1080 domain-containing protein [bacterium]|nr:DUF1080 domain-containing protein [bacterium]
MGDDPPAESLDDTDGYIVDWQGAGPYTEAGKDGKGLFDVAFPPETGGTAEWTVLPKPVQESDECPWKLIDPGVMEVRGGGIVSKRVFRDQKVHVEFRTPFMPGSDGQGRGNSGVYLQGRYEVQVLDSFGLEGLDNECGGIYKIARPRVNMCAPPLQWQTCDITFHAARFDASGVKTADPMITVFHNGVLIHENQSISQETTAGLGGDASEPGGIHLQDHGNPVQYRNIWVLPLDR